MLETKLADEAWHKFGVLGALPGAWPEQENYEIYIVDWSAGRLVTVGWSPGNWIHCDLLDMSYVPQNALECISIGGGHAVCIEGSMNCALNLRSGAFLEFGTDGCASAFSPDGNWLLTIDGDDLVAKSLETCGKTDDLRFGAQTHICSKVEGANDVHVANPKEEGTFTLVISCEAQFKILPMVQGPGGAPALDGEITSTVLFDRNFHRVSASGICASVSSHTPSLTGSTVFTIDEMFKTVSSLDLTTGKTNGLPLDMFLDDAAREPFNRIRRSVSCVDSSACLAHLRNGQLVHWIPGSVPRAGPVLEGDVIFWTPQRLLCTSDDGTRLREAPSPAKS